MKYSDKLKSPKWQKKRLEILNRDNFTCRMCGSEDKTLHIHHLEYYNCEPWEYDNRLLITLCENCHESEEFLKPFTSASIEYLTNLGFLRKDIANIVSHISNKLDTMNDVESFEYFKKLTKTIVDGKG
jgi:hypothetical protein